MQVQVPVCVCERKRYRDRDTESSKFVQKRLVFPIKSEVLNLISLGCAVFRITFRKADSRERGKGHHCKIIR